MFYRTGVIADRSFTSREDFFAPVTLTLTRWPSYTNLNRILWRYIGCAKLPKWRPSKVIVWQRQSDTTEIIYDAVSRVSKIVEWRTERETRRWLIEHDWAARRCWLVTEFIELQSQSPLEWLHDAATGCWVDCLSVFHWVIVDLCTSTRAPAAFGWCASVLYVVCGDVFCTRSSGRVWRPSNY